MSKIKIVVFQYTIPGANLPVKITIEFDSCVHSTPKNIDNTISLITGDAESGNVTKLDMGMSYIGFVHGIPDLIFNSHISNKGYFKITVEIFPNQLAI